MTARRLPVLLALFTLAAPLLVAGAGAGRQTPRDAPSRPQTGAGRISGRVLANDAAAEPIRHAILLLGGGDLLLALQTTTDDDGRFVFGGLPAGRYTLQGWRNGFVRDYYGNKRPGVGSGAPIVVAAGQDVAVTMRMTRSAVITGIVRQGAGAPATQIQVRAMQYQVVGGLRVLNQGVTMGVSIFGALGLTDDRGVYRIYGLAPGDYIIACSTAGPQTPSARVVTAAEVEWAMRSAQQPANGPAAPPPAPARPAAIAPVFYPGTTDPDASVIVTVGPGEERSGIDFTLQATPLAAVSGQLLDPEGFAPSAPQITLAGGSVLSPDQPPGRVGADGTFTLSGVRPGHYTLTARGAPHGAPAAGGPPPVPGGRGGMAQGTLFAAMDLDVNGDDITGLVVALAVGAKVSGRVVFEGGPPPDAATRVTLGPAPRAALEGVGGRGSAAMGGGAIANADGTFTISGIPPGRYVIGGFVPSADDRRWTVKSATIGGHDALDEGVELRAGQTDDSAIVTLTDRPSAIAGAIVDASGRPTAEYFVVAFPTDRRFWVFGSRRIRTSRPDTTGAFTLAVPAGEYWLAALTDVDAGEISDPAFLDSLVAASVKITVAEGETKTQTLKISGRGGGPGSGPR